MQWTSHCVPWQIDFVGVLFGLWPRFLLFLVLCCLLRCFRWRNASLAGGFAGRRVWLVSVVFVCCIYRFACSMDMLCPSTNVFPSAYAHVRTEPLARHRPHSKKKKEQILVNLWGSRTSLPLDSCECHAANAAAAVGRHSVSA